jgi:hypothetical protein
VIDRSPARKPAGGFCAKLRAMPKPSLASSHRFSGHRSSGLRLRLATLAVAVALPTFAAARADAGVTLVMQRGADAPSTLYVDGDKMRMENPSGRERTVIIDATGKRMLMVNDEAKTYMEFTEADMKRFGAMMTARRAQMQEQMKNMPPEQRKKFESMMGGAGDAKAQKPKELKFDKMGQKKTVNGFSCDMYRIVEEGTPKEEDCLAPWSAGLLQRTDFAGLRKFAEDMAKESGAMAPGGRNQMFEQFDKYPGFPVARHPLDGGQDEQLKSLKRGSIAADKFAVPAGYKKTEMPMGGMGGPGMGPHGGGMGPHGGGHMAPK